MPAKMDGSRAHGKRTMTGKPGRRADLSRLHEPPGNDDDREAPIFPFQAVPDCALQGRTKGGA